MIQTWLRFIGVYRVCFVTPPYSYCILSSYSNIKKFPVLGLFYYDFKKNYVKAHCMGVLATDKIKKIVMPFGGVRLESD